MNALSAIQNALPQVLAVLLGTTFAHAQQSYLILPDTKSPDGRYAVAFGVPSPGIDVSNPGKFMRELDPDGIENYLVDLQRNQVIATTGTRYFAAGGISKNHGSLTACWRPDSRALMIVEGGKWEFQTAAVLHIVETAEEHEPSSDVIPVTLALRRALLEKITKDHPSEADTISRFAISATPKEWTDPEHLLLDVNGSVPKDEDSFHFDGMLTVKLPEADTVTVGNDGDGRGDILRDGSIGGIRIGATDAVVLAVGGKENLGEAFKGKDELWDAIGQAVQTWIFPDAGLSVDMVSDKVGGPKTVMSISTKAPSQLRTGQGVTIGGAKADVIKAYSGYQTEPEEAAHLSTTGDIHLVGSIYGGMQFTFTDGKVSKIFLGASAE